MSFSGTSFKMFKSLLLGQLEELGQSLLFQKTRAGEKGLLL